MPLERLFLDTCIVCNIRWIVADSTFEDGFYDHKSMRFLKADAELKKDCIALRYLLDKDDEFALQFVVSEGVLAELMRTPSDARRDELLEVFWGLRNHFELRQVSYLDDSDLPAVSPGDPGLWAHFLRTGGLSFLPDESDRRLLVDSVLLQCHVFLTTDRSTIWGHRDRLQDLSIVVKRPSEYLEGFIRPLSKGNIGLCGYDDILNRMERI